MDAHNKDIDAVTGKDTTGHEWDGIRELNTPLPRWWLWMFYASIVWSIGYWVVYPSWPLVSSFTSGTLGWHSREAIATDLADLRTQRGAMMTKLESISAEDIAADPQLLAFARAVGRPAFGNNCAPCHGSGGGGAKGYANLNDDDWLWGGKLQDIEQTIRHGIRAADDATRTSLMPAFGRDGILQRPEIEAVADHVLKIAGQPVAANADLALGAKVFADNCAACHGDNGTGNRDVGAPNLTDKVWLFAPTRATIIEGIVNGRGSVMPAWANRLDDATIKALAVYVHTLSGGEK